MNPTTKGGVGSFILRTLQGKNVVDENKIFGIIGIADVSTKLVSASIDINPSGSDKAGDYTSYHLTFATTNEIPSGTYFVLKVPIDFTLEVLTFKLIPLPPPPLLQATHWQEYPTCVSPTYNGNFIGGKLSCTRLTGNKIRVDGIVGSMISGIDYRLQFSMQNPSYVIDTNTVGSSYAFDFYIYKDGT